MTNWKQVKKEAEADFMHNHTYMSRMYLAKCSACKLQHGGLFGPDHPDWARIYVCAQRTIPAIYLHAFCKIYTSTEDPLNTRTLINAVERFGVRFK